MNRRERKTLATRAVVAGAALTSAVLGLVLPGSVAYAAGMLGFMLLPLLLFGVANATPTDDGVRYGTVRSGDQRMELTIRIMGALGFAAFGFFSQARDGLMFALFGALIGNGCALLSLVSLLRSVLTPSSKTDGVTLEATMLTIENGEGQKVLRYADLEKVESNARRVVLTTAGERYGFFVGGKAGRAAVIAQAIVDAKAKAASMAQNDDGRMKELRRASGMSAREWFDRIDAVAAASRSAGAYRGGALDEEHLYGVLADDEADVESRTAAARVLASSPNPEVRTRVASSVKIITDDRTRVRVELAMRDDAEEAAAEMDALEMEELRRNAGV